MINVQIDSPWKLLCTIILFVIVGYMGIRLFSKALFISYFETKLKMRGKNKNGKNAEGDEGGIIGENKKEL